MERSATEHYERGRDGLKNREHGATYWGMQERAEVMVVGCDSLSL